MSLKPEELKNCPMCGDEAKVELQEDIAGHQDCRITCNGCMTRSDVYTTEDGYPTELAIKAWNTRPRETELLQKNANLCEALEIAEQARMEISHAINEPNWFTGGQAAAQAYKRDWEWRRDKAIKKALAENDIKELR